MKPNNYNQTFLHWWGTKYVDGVHRIDEPLTVTANDGQVEITGVLVGCGYEIDHIEGASVTMTFQTTKREATATFDMLALRITEWEV
jgi:hypothetical protein